jgi:uncharacterized membrane protein YidH (DUF202 family)
MPWEIANGNIPHPKTPRNLGLTLIALGTLALAAATWQHARFLREIGTSPFHHVWSISFVVALRLCSLACSPFYGVLLRYGSF